MTYTLITPLQSSGKMEVTPQQSEILQKELFKMGYLWAFWFNKLCYTDRPFVYWENKGISQSPEAGRESFISDELPLHLFDNHFKIQD